MFLAAVMPNLIIFSTDSNSSDVIDAIIGIAALLCPVALIGFSIILVIGLLILKKRSRGKAQDRFEKRLAQEGFKADSKIDFSPKKTGTMMSFQIDQDSQRIAIYKLGTRSILSMMNFSEIEDAQVKINEKHVVSQQLYESTVDTVISSIYLYIQSNNLEKPVYKWGVRFKKPKSEDSSYVREMVDWFYNVSSAIKLIKQKY